MAQQVDVKGFGLVEFPDNLPRETMLQALRARFADANAGKATATVAPYEPTLAERVQRGVSDFLTDKGIISNRYGAERIGENVSTALNFLPVVGDALGGDEFGRALKSGSAGDVGFAALGAIPIAGDAAKIASSAYRGIRESLPEFNRFADDVSSKIYSGRKTFFKGDSFDDDAYDEAFYNAQDAVDEGVFDFWQGSGWNESAAAILNESDTNKAIKAFSGKRLYHGSPVQFDDIELRSDGAAFLSTDKTSASHYAGDDGFLYSYEFKPSKPFFVRDQESTFDMEGAGIIPDLKERGFDSIVPLMGGDVVILNKSAIKKVGR